MNKPAWMQELVMLCEQFAYLGMCPDLVAMNQTELWGLHCHLIQLKESHL